MRETRLNLIHGACNQRWLQAASRLVLQGFMNGHSIVPDRTKEPYSLIRLRGAPQLQVFVWSDVFIFPQEVSREAKIFDTIRY